MTNIVEDNLMFNLVTILNDWTKAYDEGHPKVSDKEWDEAYFQLKELEQKTGIVMPDSPTNKIKYEVKSKLNKIVHNHKMLSLDKTKDWDEFINYFASLNPSKDVCNMLKMDGLTCSLRYLDGKLISAETRGNGEIGEDILHNAKTLASIPQNIEYKEELIIDGEVICTYNNFEQFSDLYKNPRNFASGSIRLLDANECKKRNLTFVAWNVVKGFKDDNSFSSRIEKIRKLGFICVPYIMSFDYDAKDYLVDIAKSLGYPIDGLVGRFDDIKYGRSLGETGHHIRAAYAFKFYDEEYETELRNIEWTMGRTGVLTPIAVFDPIDTDDTVISRASLHNVSVMEELLGKPYYGQKIKVFKANMIIPQISSAEKRSTAEFNAEDTFYVPTICPVCGEEAFIEESDSGVKNLVCANPNCAGKLINRLDHFCGKKGLDIKGLSKATLEKLIDWGWLENISDIFILKEYKKEWVKKPGFGVKSVENILNAIEDSKEVTLDKFIAALGIPLIGTRVSKDLIKYISSYEDFREKVDSHFDFSKYDGFADSKTIAIWKYDYTDADKIYNEFISIKKEDDDKKENILALDGITFVITGKLSYFKNRSELQNDIEFHGGRVVGSISKKVDYLINNDVNSTSSKNVSAKKMGIPIISEEEYIKKFF